MSAETPVKHDAENSGENVVEIRKLLNKVSNFVLHRDLDFDVHAGEVMTLVGGSGSGKTQLVRVILGLKRPSAGVVRVFGVSWDGAGYAQIRATRERMGMLFQNGALYSALTVFQNVAFPLRERGGLDEDAIHAIVHAKLAQVELEPQHADLMPANLSGGMVKRVSLARAMALSPELLILDEPTAGLDPDRSEAFVRLIKRLRTEYRFAVLMVTHDLDTLHDLTDRIAVLADQHIIACGSVDEVRSVEHRFVQSFFGGERGRRAFKAA
jgi:phospholipid/cholesterol/gamma-HCH transport system ATP-binding protein